VAKDSFHDAVRSALEKEAWVITDDPFKIRISPTTNLYVDLGAERVIAAIRAEDKIAVEVKSFIGTSSMFEFHLAVGQFTNYRYALADFEPDRKLYLAVPVESYNDFFKQDFIQSVIQRSEISLLIYEPEQGEIVQWTS